VAWNEFSSAEGSQVATIACQDNVDPFFFYAARNIHHEFGPEGIRVSSSSFGTTTLCGFLPSQPGLSKFFCP
jgi:hypothetical protein